MNVSEHPILFFDGVCLLCNRMLRFVLKHDKKQLFRFATLQSAQGIAAKEQVRATAADSVILLYKGKYYTKSGAVLRTAWLLGGVWALLAVGFIIPRFIRDGLYDYVASHWYQWFGKSDSCMLPDPAIRSRFVSE